MQSVEYYLGIGRSELIFDDQEHIVECINGSITTVDGEIYTSKGGLSDCASCINYSGEMFLPCAVNPNYIGDDICADFEEYFNRDTTNDIPFDDD